MNANTFNGILRAVVPAALAFAVGKGWIPQSSVTDLSTALVTVGAAAWSIITNIEAKGT